MMETPNTLNSGMCRCCSSEGTFKDIKTQYHWMGEEEVYAEMLTDCFDIKIQTPEDMDNGICEVCITQLRNAVNFKKQVLHTEEQFKRRLQGRDVKNPIKIESAEDPIDSDHLSDPDFTEEYEVPIKQELEEKPKAKKRQAKSATPRAKKAKTDAESSQRVARRTRIITIDATNQKAGIKLAISPNVLRLPKGGPSETRKNLHNLDFPLHTPVVKTGRPVTSAENKLPIIISTSCLKQLTSVTKTQKKPSTKSSTPSQRLTNSGREVIKNQQNLEIILRHSNATPTLGHRGIGYACFFCSIHFPDPADLKRHSLEFHDDNKRHPTLPPLQFDNLSVKLDITNLKCTICFKSYALLSDLLHHLRVDHDQPIHADAEKYWLPFRFDSDRLTCAVCDTEYTAFKMLLEHMNNHYRNYICDICDAGFVTKVSLRSHKRSHENGDYKCDQCHQVYNTIVKLRYHIRYAHQGQDKRHKCAYCGERFLGLIMKNNHQVKVHGVAPTLVKCKACDKTFQNNQGLRVHYKVHHLMIKEFKCLYCEMAFSTNCDLINHTVKHTGARDFKCDICQKAYGKKDTLVQHMRSHNIDSRHKCTLCPMEFLQKCTLKSHMRSKHGIKRGKT
ncbi:zinc finger protein 354B-like isoform X2 [Cydia strobilella]|uniref:zinc finger protein 354B-like isoform X2 n=1 Tax=Cydia strobilella TaxID=1100964 RepID=UPI003007B028